MTPLTTFGDIRDPDVLEEWQELTEETFADERVLERINGSYCAGVYPFTPVPKALVTLWNDICGRIFTGQILLCGHAPDAVPVYIYAAVPGSAWCERCTGRYWMGIHAERKRKRLPYALCDACGTSLVAELSQQYLTVFGPWVIVAELCGPCAYGWRHENENELAEGPPR